MAEASLTLKRVVEELVLEQIYAFKQSAQLSADEILEYHLRHYQIMELYHQLDQATVPGAPPKGWLDCGTVSFPPCAGSVATNRRERVARPVARVDAHKPGRRLGF